VPAHKIDFYLTAANPLRALAAEVRHLTELQQTFLKAAPPALTQSCRVGALRGDILILLADNAAIAAKLKQLTARLLTSFRNQGFKATSIQIRVQVDRPWADPAAPRSKRLSPETIENFEKLAGELEDSPLKRALSTMAINQKKQG
jgi:hypothetical protein